MPPTDPPIDVTDILAQPREFAQKLARVERERAELIETVSRLRAECNDAQAVARAERAEAETVRLTELLSEAVIGVGYAVTFGAMVSKGETIDNCGDPDAVLYLLGEAQSIETRLRAALRQPAQARDDARAAMIEILGDEPTRATAKE